MAAKRKKQDEDELTGEVSTGLSDDLASPIVVSEEPSDIQTETGVAEDDGFYEMGNILVAEESEDKSDIEVREASKKLKKPADADEDTDDNAEEWRDDENHTDVDDFLDQADVDWENYEHEKEDY